MSIVLRCRTFTHQEARGNVLEIVGRPLTLTLLVLGLGALVAPLVMRRLPRGAISAEPAQPAR